MVNSKFDEEYIDCDEQDMIEINGIAKRYFDTQSLQQFMGDYQKILLDDSGFTQKDSALGNERLVRFIGKKV